jgi:hypothetical protein
MSLLTLQQNWKMIKGLTLYTKIGETVAKEKLLARIKLCA